MKRIGLIGGLGPESTLDYYREMIGLAGQLNKGAELNYPEIIIYSVNMDKFITMLQKRDYPGAAGYLSECINKLAAGGADFAAISANTPHMMFDRIRKDVEIPLISIVETCREKAVQSGLKKCALLGTKFTMKASFFADEFEKAGIEVISPDDADIDRINEFLFAELEHGIFKESTKNEILEIIGKMKNEKEVDSVILGCTEFPLMFREDEYLGIPFLNTSRIHVEKIIEESFRE